MLDTIKLLDATFSTVESQDNIEIKNVKYVEAGQSENVSTGHIPLDGESGLMFTNDHSDVFIYRAYGEDVYLVKLSGKSAHGVVITLRALANANEAYKIHYVDVDWTKNEYLPIYRDFKTEALSVYFSRLSMDGPFEHRVTYPRCLTMWCLFKDGTLHYAAQSGMLYSDETRHGFEHQYLASTDIKFKNLRNIDGCGVASDSTEVSLSLTENEKPFYFNFTGFKITSSDVMVFNYDGEGLQDRLLMGAIVDFKSPTATIRIIGDLLRAGVEDIYYHNDGVLEKYNVESHIDSADALADSIRGVGGRRRDFGDLSRRGRR